MDPDMEVMDDHAVKWGQRAGAPGLALLMLPCFLLLLERKVCLFKTKQQQEQNTLPV